MIGFQRILLRSNMYHEIISNIMHHETYVNQFENCIVYYLLEYVLWSRLVNYELYMQKTRMNQIF